MPKYSVIIPVYNEEVFLADFYKKLTYSIKDTNAFEIIFVNDGSTDYSTKILNHIAENNPQVKIVNLSKNYGKQIAITAGMEQASGDAVIVLTIKPSNPYNAIDALVSSYQNGNEIVFAYSSKKTNWFKERYRIFKRKCMQFMMKMFKIKGTLLPRPDAELYDRKVVDVMNELKDKNMYLRRVDALMGYKRDYVAFDAKPLTKKELEEIKMHKFDFISERIMNNEHEPKKLKKRFYIKSLWASLGLFIGSAFLFIALALEIIFLNKPLLAILTAIVTACVLWLSITYYIKSLLIKRLGVFLPTNKELYKISNILN